MGDPVASCFGLAENDQADELDALLAGLDDAKKADVLKAVNAEGAFPRSNPVSLATFTQR